MTDIQERLEHYEAKDRERLRELLDDAHTKAELELQQREARKGGAREP